MNHYLISHRVIAQSLFIAALSIFPFVNAYSQEKTETPEASERPTTVMNEVVVTASRDEESAFDAPMAVNVIRKEDIRRKVSMSMEDLFRDIPGVDASSTGPGSVRPIVRGMMDERVLILVDGIRLSEQRPGGNHILSLDPAQIERVEIVRGPSSVLYGSDAIGGVMNVFTKKAPLIAGDETRFSGETSFNYESANDGFKPSAHTAFGRGNWNGYVGGFYQNTDNVETHSGDLNFSHYKGGTFWLGGNYVEKDWSHELGYSLMQADIGIPAPADFVKDQFKDEKQHFLHGTAKMDDLSDLVTHLNIDYGWQLHERSRVRKPTAAREVDIFLDIHTMMLEPTLTLNPHENHEIKTGFAFFFEDASSDRNMIGFPVGSIQASYDNVPVIPDSNRYGIGIFAQDEIKITQDWSVIPGLRLDYIHTTCEGAMGHQVTNFLDEDDSAISGNLGTLYHITPEWNLFANAGRAFRAPTLLERFFDGPHDGTGVDQGNPNLEPETSWNFDIGAKANYEKFTATTSLFYNMIEDYTIKRLTNPAAAPADQIYAWENVSDARVYGVETDFNYKLDLGFSLFGGMTFTQGYDETNHDDLPNISPLKGTYGLRWEQLVEDRFDVFCEVQGTTAARQSDPGTGERETAGWTTFDFRTGVTMDKNFSVNFVVENIFDRNYHDHLSSVWQTLNVDDQPRRNFKIAATYRW
ncbi:MAG: TonB-dependent receptor plug domain-containing protein [Verrucomicrobiota bacterium]